MWSHPSIEDDTGNIKINESTELKPRIFYKYVSDNNEKPSLHQERWPEKNRLHSSVFDFDINVPI